MKDERGGHKNHHMMSYHIKVRQNVSKRLKARQMCVDDDENAISKKPPLLIGQDTQHKLVVAFMVRECKNDEYHYAYYTV